MEHEYPRTEVRINWTWARGEDGGTEQEVTLGWLIVPGLAVANLEGVPDAYRHWSVVQLEAGQVMIGHDLCEACAFEAAKVLAEVPGGWDRPVDVLKDDRGTYDALQRAEDFGPCYPPPGVEEQMGIKFRVAGHTPGQPLDRIMGPQVGMLIPADMPDPPPEIARMIKERVQAESARQSRPWYEQED